RVLHHPVEPTGTLLRGRQLRKGQNRKDANPGIGILIECPGRQNRIRERLIPRQNIERCSPDRSRRMSEPSAYGIHGRWINALRAKTIKRPDGVQRTRVQAEVINALVVDEPDEVRNDIELTPI